MLNNNEIKSDKDRASRINNCCLEINLGWPVTVLHFQKKNEESPTL